MDVEELLRETPAPPMSVAPEAVLREAHSRGRRRRNRWIGAGAGVAAAAAVTIAVGTSLPDSSSTSPMPAHTSAATLGSFFQRTGDEAKLPRDQVTTSEMSSGQTATPGATYQVYKSATGALKLRRLEKGASTNLPVVARFADGGSSALNGNQTVVVRPVPRDITSASLTFNAEADPGLSGTGSVVLPDGSTAAVFVTEKPVDVARDNGLLSWWTTSGQLIASTGEVADQVVLPGASTDGSPIVAWNFPTLGRCGTKGDHGDGSTYAAADGGCTISMATGPGEQQMSQFWMSVRPGPVSAIRATRAPGSPAATIHQTPLGSGRVVLWATATSHSKPANNDYLGLFSSVTWIGPDGKKVTYAPKS